MDSGALKVDNHVPQGIYGYQPNDEGAMILEES
jgi:hypothetical protein